MNSRVVILPNGRVVILLGSFLFGRNVANSYATGNDAIFAIVNGLHIIIHYPCADSGRNSRTAGLEPIHSSTCTGFRIGDNRRCMWRPHRLLGHRHRMQVQSIPWCHPPLESQRLICHRHRMQRRMPRSSRHHRLGGSRSSRFRHSGGGDSGAQVQRGMARPPTAPSSPAPRTPERARSIRPMPTRIPILTDINRDIIKR